MNRGRTGARAGGGLATCHPMAMASTSSAGTALLLVNLGTPDAPTAAAVRRYLAEFLSDRRVVQLPRVLWWPLLYGLVLPLRSARVARKYAEAWLPGGSPLAVHTAELAEAVQARMPGVPVAHAMRYGSPAFADVLNQLHAGGATKVLVLPLYPQYSTTTTASVGDVVELARAAGHRDGAVPACTIGMVAEYHLDARWVQAVADSIRAHWNAHGRGERLLLSFHGIPQRLVDAGDPYEAQCRASAAAIADALGLAKDDWMPCFQSRFGRERWLQPYTSDTLEALAKAGIARVDVVCPGFAVDCLETLEEIAIENAELFREAGGEALRYIPCLNATPAHADALAGIASDALAPGGHPT